MLSAGIAATSHKAGTGIAGSRSAGSAGVVKCRSGCADQLPASAWPARPGAVGFGSEDEAADLEQLPAVALAVGAEAVRRPGQRDGDRLVADHSGDGEARNPVHALAVDPGMA